MRFILTAGQAADITQAIPLMKDIGGTDALLADKGYDANALLDWLGQRETTAVISPKANRKAKRSCDWYIVSVRATHLETKLSSGQSVHDEVN